MSERSAAFHMADVRAKRITARRAVAVGELLAGSAFDAIVERRLPKGDAMGMAEVAGLQGAKNAAQLMPLCHPLALEYAELRCVPVPERRAIRVYCEAAAIARVRLLFKEGGKKGLWFHPDGMTDAEREHYHPRGLPKLDGVPAAVITLSDRASRGDYEDASGPLLVERLRALGAELGPAEVRADAAAPLAARLRELAAAGIRLALCTGGTGLSPRDVTPEALALAGERRVPGIAEMFRSESSQHTPLAWLSRADAVLVDSMLVIALPGSSKAVAQGMEILAPILAHALAMAAGEGHA